MRTAELSGEQSSKKSGEKSDAKGAAFVWQNPVLRGTVPDPSLVRVGPDYFLASSTFEHLPGIRLFHSRDLVSWTCIGAAIDRAAQYRRDGKPGALCLFAPTLRYYSGRFYLVCTNTAEGQGNFLLCSEEPSQGWSDAIWLDAAGFDPSLFFDLDGTCYYTRRTLDLSDPGQGLGPIAQAVIDPASGALGPLRALTPGRSGFCSNDIEGPRLFRRGDWYYLSAAEGGTWLGHMQTIARSRSPWGPFEPAPQNPILTHRHRVMHPIQSLGHCDFVEDEQQRWWALSLGTRHKGRHHSLGRETFLHAVDWRDGWPHLGMNGTTELECRAAQSPRSLRPQQSGQSGQSLQTKGRRWTGRQRAASAGWSSWGLAAEPAEYDGDRLSFLAGLSFDKAPPEAPAGALFLHQQEFEQELRVTLPAPLPGVTLGAAIVADARHFISLRCQGRGDRQTELTRCADDLLARTSYHFARTGIAEIVLHAARDGYRMRLYGVDGEEIALGPFSARLLSAEACEDFTGVKFALLAEAQTAQRVAFRLHKTATRPAVQNQNPAQAKRSGEL